MQADDAVMAPAPRFMPLSFGVEALDALPALRGLAGFLPGDVVEVYGPSAERWAQVAAGPHRDSLRVSRCPLGSVSLAATLSALADCPPVPRVVAVDSVSAFHWQDASAGNEGIKRQVALCAAVRRLCAQGAVVVAAKQALLAPRGAAQPWAHREFMHGSWAKLVRYRLCLVPQDRGGVEAWAFSGGLLLVLSLLQALLVATHAHKCAGGDVYDAGPQASSTACIEQKLPGSGYINGAWAQLFEPKSIPWLYTSVCFWLDTAAVPGGVNVTVALRDKDMFNGQPLLAMVAHTTVLVDTPGGAWTSVNWWWWQSIVDGRTDDFASLCIRALGEPLDRSNVSLDAWTCEKSAFMDGKTWVDL
eukprot:m51a1_g2128 hypothetical protein (360) ;mRNA; f:1694001-1699586